jgi:hypothetical protein
MNEYEVNKYIMKIKTNYLMLKLPEQLREPAYKEVAHWFDCADMYANTKEMILSLRRYREGLL